MWRLTSERRRRCAYTLCKNLTHPDDQSWDLQRCLPERTMWSSWVTAFRACSQVLLFPLTRVRVGDPRLRTIVRKASFESAQNVSGVPWCQQHRSGLGVPWDVFATWLVGWASHAVERRGGKELCRLLLMRRCRAVRSRTKGSYKIRRDGRSTAGRSTSFLLKSGCLIRKAAP